MPSPVAQSSTQTHMAPDWEKKDTPPGRGCPAAKLALREQAVLMSPREFGPKSSIPASRATRVSSCSARKPCLPVSRKPAASTMAARTPREARSASSGRAAARGRQSTARSTPRGKSAEEARGASPATLSPAAAAAGLTAWTAPLYPAAKMFASTMPPTLDRLREAPTTATEAGAKSADRDGGSDMRAAFTEDLVDQILASVQDDIHYRFKQVKLLELALAHSSWANEQGSPELSNERLEFLGDAVLELCVSEEAYRRFPDSAEGLLTKLRSRLVKTGTLAGVARSLGLHRRLLLGRGEEAQGGRERDSLLADALEALFGAVFLDGGFAAARELVLRLLDPLWPETPALPGGKDCKSRLQELTQERFRQRPVYALVDSSGPEHHKVFEVEALLPDGQRFRATGPSLKKAEQAAARSAMDALSASPSPNA